MTETNALTQKFRHVRLVLAREKAIPKGTAKTVTTCWFHWMRKAVSIPLTGRRTSRVAVSDAFGQARKTASDICAANPAGNGILTTLRAMMTMKSASGLAKNAS